MIRTECLYYQRNGTMERYEIWKANVKFEDSNETKTRPILIWNDKAFLIAYKLTGTDRGDGKDEYRIRYWKEAGLSKPTSIRIRKVLKMGKEDLLYKIGELDKRERLLFEMRIIP